MLRGLSGQSLWRVISRPIRRQQLPVVESLRYYKPHIKGCACRKPVNINTISPTGCFLLPNVRVRYDNDGWWTLKRQQSLQIRSCVRMTWLVIRPDVWLHGPAQIRVDCHRQEDTVTVIVIDFSTDSFELFLSKESHKRTFYIGFYGKTYYKFVPLKPKPVSTKIFLFICDVFY